MRHRTPRWTRALWLAAAVAAAGCASSAPTRFYVLAARSDDGSAVYTSKLRIGVGPVTLPGYLDRPQIVSRQGENELKMAEFDHWGEDLDQGVSRALADNLSILLQTDTVDVYPWELSRKIDYQVVVDLIRFERQGTGDVLLDARWRIFRVEDRRALGSHRSTHRIPAPVDDYDATVAAMSDVVAALGRDVAEAIRAL